MTVPNVSHKQRVDHIINNALLDSVNLTDITLQILRIAHNGCMRVVGFEVAKKRLRLCPHGTLIQPFLAVISTLLLHCSNELIGTRRPITPVRKDEKKNHGPHQIPKARDPTK